jgi:hypothetical protein
VLDREITSEPAHQLFESHRGPMRGGVRLYLADFAGADGSVLSRFAQSR